MSKNVVVIEHNQVLADMMKERLVSLGYEVHVVTDGSAAYEQVRKLKPDIVTLEIMMPNLNGLVILEELKSSEETRDIPIIIISIAGSHSARNSLQLGAVDFLQKPLDFKKLDKKIRSFTSKKSILVVDDDLGILKLLEVRLGFMGYRVITASDGENACAKARIEKPDIILIDVVLPDMDGFEVINRLKNDCEVADVPVIAFTGHVSLDGMDDFLGVDKFVGKNFSADDLITEVDHYLKTRI